MNQICYLVFIMSSTIVNDCLCLLQGEIHVYYISM
jgi:hypothetical protein